MNNLLKCGDIRQFTNGRHKLVAVVIAVDEVNKRYETISDIGARCTIDFDYEAKIVKLPEQVRNLLRGIAIKMQERVHHEDCIRSIDNNLELSRKMLFDLSYKPKKDGLPF